MTSKAISGLRLWAVSVAAAEQGADQAVRQAPMPLSARFIF